MSGPRSLAVTVVAQALGAALLVAGWVGASGRVTVAAQSGFVVLAAAGLVIAGAGAALHLGQAKRRLAERAVRLEAAFVEHLADRAP